jgi:septal ring factor EnvC (AmiA/AmiB activator)
MDLINNLIRWIGSINNLQQSISECRSENIKLQNALILLADDNSKIKASLSQLQQENDILRSKADDLGILQQNSGVLFPQFPKLPPEIRR